MIKFKSDGEVLDQGFDFRAAWWQRPAVPQTWSSVLDELPVSEHNSTYRRIRRQDLLGRPSVDPDDCGRLLLLCYVWGTGPQGGNVGRRSLVFRDTSEAVLGTRLVEVRQLLKSDGPSAAYTALTDGGDFRTKHMRASFFTKFLYAADAGEDSSCGRALILDQFVARALNDLHGWGLRPTSGWSPESYQHWIDFAHDQAAAADPPVRPDAVEMAYFEHGRGLSRQRRSR